VTLGFDLHGPDDAPVLVLSGALGTTTAMWDAQLPAFAGSYRVLRHDLPGHGTSPLPDGRFGVGDIGAAVLELLDRLAIERSSFCGLSLGGMVGMWLAAEAPERIDRLVLACTGPSLGTPEVYVERAALVRAEGTEVTVDGARERWFTPAFRDTAAARAILDQLRATSRLGYAACCEAVGAFDFHGRLTSIAAPTLALFGAEDPVTTPEVVDALVSGIPGATAMFLPEAAHLANVEQPEAFSATVLRHLEERVPV
jgi:3-oxoadipate enol-lactonase